MKTFFSALWQGLVNGAQTKTRDAAAQPQSYGLSASFPQALYWFGFEVANIVVYGARKAAAAADAGPDTASSSKSAGVQ